MRSLEGLLSPAIMQNKELTVFVPQESKVEETKITYVEKEEYASNNDGPWEFPLANALDRGLLAIKWPVFILGAMYLLNAVVNM